MSYLQKVSQHRIAPPSVNGGELAADLIDGAFLSYNAGRLREVCRVFTRKMLEPDCTVGLSLSGALTPAGLGDADVKSVFRMFPPIRSLAASLGSRLDQVVS